MQTSFKNSGPKFLIWGFLLSCLFVWAFYLGAEEDRTIGDDELKFLDDTDTVPSHTNIVFRKIPAKLSDGKIVEALVHQFIEGDYFNLTLIISKQENAEDSVFWRWDPIWQTYAFDDNTAEQGVWVFLKEKEQAAFSDLWIWRPSRNTYWGFADDFHCIELSNPSLTEQPTRDPASFFKAPVSYIKDKGELCWASRYFAKFAGEKIPRYYQRSPSGSAGDLVFSGALKKRFWILKFRRKVNTENLDDIRFKQGENIIIGIHVGTPEKNPPEIIPFSITINNT